MTHAREVLAGRSGAGPKSERAWATALACMPGGVSSPVRAFGAVGGTPLFFERGVGSSIFDVDGREYIDCVLSWGPLILGHAHPAVVAAVGRAMTNGASFGAPTQGESELAHAVIARFGGRIEQLRFVSSGTEATMSAIRLARGFTGRDLIVKIDGCYHGHSDGLLIAAGSGPATFGTPTSPGVPKAIASLTLSIPFGSASAFESACRAHPGQIAAIIFEPVAGNMGVVAPPAGYLPALQQIARENGALLIADEVMTGLRVAADGACSRYDFTPDLIALGKVLGGGLPVGAYGGRRAIMERLSPAGPIYQAGTLSGNPLAMAAGNATLAHLDAAAYQHLERTGARLERGLLEALERTSVSAQVARVGSMLTLFFTREPGAIDGFSKAMKCDREMYARFFHCMLARGVYLPPSQFESWFLSTAHSEKVIDAIIAAATESLHEIASEP